MRKKHFLIAGAVVLCLVIIGALWGLYLFNKPHEGVEGIRPLAKLEAAELFGAFQADEAGANKRYLGQVLEVRGRVTAVTNADSALDVQLEGGSGVGGINCSMAPGEKGKSSFPAKGAMVTVKGRCTGYLMDVNLVDCIVEQIER